jgi:hypothetical protein
MTSFTTERYFGTLAASLGSFPFDYEDSTPQSEFPGFGYEYSEFDRGW